MRLLPLKLNKRPISKPNLTFIWSTMPITNHNYVTKTFQQSWWTNQILESVWLTFSFNMGRLFDLPPMNHLSALDDNETGKNCNHYLKYPPEAKMEMHEKAAPEELVSLHMARWSSSIEFEGSLVHDLPILSHCSERAWNERAWKSTSTKLKFTERCIENKRNANK